MLGTDKNDKDCTGGHGSHFAVYVAFDDAILGIAKPDYIIFNYSLLSFTLASFFGKEIALDFHGAFAYCEMISGYD